MNGDDSPTLKALFSDAGAAVGQRISRSRFSSDSLPAREQFDAFNDWFSPLINVTPTSEVRQGFPFAHSSIGFERMLLINYRRIGSLSERDARQVRKDPVDMVSIVTLREGRCDGQTESLDYTLVPGEVLIRDASAHRDAFEVMPEYLQSTARGLASGHWLNDYGLQTSRGFKALKIWMSLKEHGVEKFGRLIDQNIAQAHYLSGLIEAEPLLELVAPTNINIVCYRYRPAGADGALLKTLNTEIMLRMQEAGVASVSDTTVRGEHCLRVAINNHRTRRNEDHPSLR